jgi:hypothetical protein
LKLDINPDISIDQFKDLLNKELQLNAKSIKLELENEDAFGKILEAGSLKSNGCKNGSTVSVTAVDIDYGTNTKASPAKSNIHSDHFDPSHSANAWREHSPGVNYEALCPNASDKKVIINRGFGIFDWATDPLELKCSCCHQKVDPRTISRIAVNHCEWTWGGITDEGEKIRQNGVTQDLNRWIIDGSRHWRKLFIKATDPFQPLPKPPTVFITCALCKSEFPQDQIEVISQRQLCRFCAKRVHQALEERNKNKPQQISANADSQDPAPSDSEQQKAQKFRNPEKKVLLPGLGQQIELRKIFRPSREGGEAIQ